MSKREAPMAIISIAQQARPNVMGQMELLRIQFTTLSSEVRITPCGCSDSTPTWPNSGLSAKVIASLAVFWALAQQIGSLMAGGYVAGRMRTRWHEAGHEAEFRDGLHGGLVWAVGVLISAFLVFATAGIVARTGAEVAGKAAASVSSTGIRWTWSSTPCFADTAQAAAPPAAVPRLGGPA
jgi:hypothetical protein